MGEKKLSDEQEYELCRLYKTGDYTLSSLRVFFPVSSVTIGNILKRHGHKIKTRKEIYDKIKFGEVVEKFLLAHNDEYDYSKVVYGGYRTRVEIICRDHGSFWQLPYLHIRGAGCPRCCFKNKSLSAEDFIKRSKIIHNDKYDYSKVEYTQTKSKVIIICPTHGEWEQIPSSHLRGNGCLKCEIERKTKTTDVFIQRAREIHEGKYDYSKVEYINNNKKIIIVCPIHGEYLQIPRSHISGAGCPLCIVNKGENRIKKFLDKELINYIQQYRFTDCRNPLTNCMLIFDFYLPVKNILIEYDGIYHFEEVKWFGGEEKLLETKVKDGAKNDYCFNNKIKLIRIRYSDFENIEIILNQEVLNGISSSYSKN